MIKIVKYGSEFNIPKSSVVKLDATYDGLIVTLSDNTEVRFSFAVSPQIKAVLPIVKSTPADIVTLNLDYAISGQYDKVLKLETKVVEPPHPVTIENVVVGDKKDVKKSTTKKLGRPSKSTSKKTK